MKRFIIVFAVLLLIGWLGWSVFQQVNQTPSQGFQRGGEKPPVAVETVTAQTQKLQDVRTLTGTAFPQSEITLSSRVGGRLEWFQVEEGSLIRRGQLLGKIEDASYQQQIRQLEADLQVVQASLDEVLIQQRLAEQELDRAITLQQQKMLSDSELDAARADLERTHARLRVIEAQILQKEAAIDQVKITLADTQIRAQWPGSLQYYTASQRHVQAGTTLAQGSRLLTLIDISTIRGRLKVTEADYARIQVGQNAQIVTQAQPDTPYAGKITRKLPNLDAQTRSGEIEVQIHNPGGKLKPGMFLKANLILATQPQAQTVVNQAVVKQGDKEGIFQVNPDGETVSFVPIQVGIRTPTVTEVRSPKLTGQVVTRGNHLLKTGSKIRLPGAGDPHSTPPKPGKPESQNAQPAAAPDKRLDGKPMPKPTPSTAGTAS